MAYDSTNWMFRSLDDVGELTFREYARTHVDGVAAMSVEDWSVLHPVCRDEWRRLGVAPAHASGIGA